MKPNVFFYGNNYVHQESEIPRYSAASSRINHYIFSASYEPLSLSLDNIHLVYPPGTCRVFCTIVIRNFVVSVGM